MRKEFIIFIIFIFSNCILLAQKETNHWLIGNSFHLNFTNGVTANYEDSSFTIVESSISISDTSGNLKFFCNGRKVWSNDFSLLTHGDSIMGNTSATQSISIKIPNNDSLHLIFTTGGQGNDIYLDMPIQKGLYYSILNANGNNGLGSIVKKNILLDTLATERISAVKHANGVDIWVTIKRYNEPTFFSYLITENGIDTVPIVSYVGSIENFQVANSGIGQMKFTHKGKFLALCNSLDNKIELYNFNNTTGLLSEYAISNKMISNSASYRMYGLEFSPNDSILYCTQLINGAPSNLLQINIYNGAANPLNTYKVLSTSNSPIGLQLALDGRIYGVTVDNNFPPYDRRIDFINKPNLEDSCSLVTGLFYFNSPATSLPNYEQSIFLVQQPNAVKQVKKMRRIEVHPNPNKGIFSVILPGSFNAEGGTIFIRDITGKKVFEQSVTVSDQSELMLNLEHLSNAIYILELSENKGSHYFNKIEILK